MSAREGLTPRAWRWLLVVAVACVGVGWALESPATRAVEDAREDTLEPLESPPSACRLRGDEALGHARALEQVAAARWERVPFALSEAPHAVMQMAEAEACYAVTGDREGRLRAETKRRVYAAEVERRFVRARLLLQVETRAGRPDRARIQVQSLLALLERAPDSAQPYRAELTRLSRTYAADARERAETERKNQ